MGQNGGVVRSESPRSRRGRRRGRGTWVTIDGARPPATAEPGRRPGATGAHTGAAPAPASDPSRYEPRRRYPWHDDPDYDPAAHRRAAAPQAWTPPQPWTPTQPAPTGATAMHPAAPAPPVGAGRPVSHDATASGAATAFLDDPAVRVGPGRAAAGPTPAGPPPPGPAPTDEPGPAPVDPSAPRMPRKLTVTRVAAFRSRQITRNGLRAFHRAAGADGADRSGLAALTYATMMTYAVDAAVAVALANTLFFAAATAESKTNVALYLAITVAPFAVVAPVIGPLLDRLQRGRRAALATSFGGRAVLAVVMAVNYDTWLLYPAALGVLVLSKSFVVLKAAVTPRVLPAAITLVTTNARLTTFGMVAGGVCGAIAAGTAALSGSPGALLFTSALGVVGAVLCLRIPRWVESTAGEVPAALRSTVRGRRRPITRGVLVALWGNGAIRALSGFLTLFVAFVVKAQTETDPGRQLVLLGVVGVAAGVGSFAGNAAGSRRRLGRSDSVVLGCVAVAVAVAVVAAVLPGIVTAVAVGLFGAAASATAKVGLDAVIQRDLPEESRASAFGRSETVLQLTWVFGGALGVLLPHDTYRIGFVVIAAAVALAGLQTAFVSRGRTLLPFLAPRAPRPAPVGPRP